MAETKIRLRVLGPGSLRRRWRDIGPGQEFDIAAEELPGLASAMAPRKTHLPDGSTVEISPLVVVAADWDRKLAEEQRVAAEQAQQRAAQEQIERRQSQDISRRRRFQAVEGDVARAKMKLATAEARLVWYDEAIAAMRAEGAPPSRISDSEHLRRVVSETVRVLRAEAENAAQRWAEAQAAEKQAAA